MRLCGASGSPPASNPYCPSTFLLAVAIFEPISSRSPPPSALLPAPSSHRPPSTVHRASSIIHSHSPSSPASPAGFVSVPARLATDRPDPLLCMGAWARARAWFFPFCPLRTTYYTTPGSVVSAVGWGPWVRIDSKPWLSRRIRRVRRGPAGPDDPPPHQGSLPPGAASLGLLLSALLPS